MPGKKKSVRNERKRRRDLEAQYDYHLPVMLRETLDLLIWEKCGIYVDGTLGGGGHAAEILAALGERGKLLAFDKDPGSIEHVRMKFEEELKSAAPRLSLYNECYGNACGVAREFGLLSGLLLDLGVSSRQLDTDTRGLSYRVDSSLDMRFGPAGETAEQLLSRAPEEEIERILRAYGEEPFARVIARRIVERRRASALHTTFDLRAAVEQSVPESQLFKALSRVFQAFRIAVNSELETLERALRDVSERLKPGGRIVVLSYHSLEDRIVKNVFKELTKHEKFNKYSAQDSAKGMPKFRLLLQKPAEPSEDEILRNPRARSARLRAVEKLPVGERSSDD